MVSVGGKKPTEIVNVSAKSSLILGKNKTGFHVEGHKC